MKKISKIIVVFLLIDCNGYINKPIENSKVKDSITSCYPKKSMDLSKILKFSDNILCLLKDTINSTIYKHTINSDSVKILKFEKLIQPNEAEKIVYIDYTFDNPDKIFYLNFF